MPEFSTNYFSGAGRTRTDDPRVANAVLSQLSYSPDIIADGRLRIHAGNVCRAYGEQFEPCNPQFKWAYMDSNHGPRRYQRRALTN